MMKIFQVFTKSLIFVLTFSALAFAQTKQTQNNDSTQVAVINRELFYDKNKGITELVNIVNLLTAEFKSSIEELDSLRIQILSLQKELEDISAPRLSYPRNLGALIKEKTNKYELLIAKHKAKESEVRPLYEKRWAETGAVEEKKVAGAIKLFAKEKGYIIFDNSIVTKGLVLAIDNDITEEFIKYYNDNFAKTETQ